MQNFGIRGFKMRKNCKKCGGKVQDKASNICNACLDEQISKKFGSQKVKKEDYWGELDENSN
jgi:ribosomal protein L37E